MRIIAPTLTTGPHSCRRYLPATKGGYGPTEKPYGTLAVCQCGKVWVVDDYWTGTEMELHWRLVEWFERKLRRRARKYSGIDLGQEPWSGTSTWANEADYDG